MVRSIVGVLTGIVMAGAVIAFGEATSHLLMGRLPGVSPEPIGATMASMSLVSLVAVLVAWAIGTFIGAGVAALVARHGRVLCALLVGCTVMAAAMLNMLTLPHAAWFWAAALLIVVPTAWLAGRLVSPSPVR